MSLDGAALQELVEEVKEKGKETDHANNEKAQHELLDAVVEEAEKLGGAQEQEGDSVTRAAGNSGSLLELQAKVGRPGATMAVHNGMRAHRNRSKKNGKGGRKSSGGGKGGGGGWVVLGFVAFLLLGALLSL
mmetsp:Transcript_10185/g.25491  ORF Transcript_10185/g.25491 Transcript_10185/m.25491 type:complete len:132 (+) Transcript_10185:3-398(+)